MNNELNDMIRRFKEHSEVIWPDWLGSSWEDASWHNDACPHAMMYLTPEAARVRDNSPIVEVWVNYAAPEDREVPPLYMVVWHKDWEYDDGGESLYEGDDERLARRWAHAAEVAAGALANDNVRDVTLWSVETQGMAQRILDLCKASAGPRPTEADVEVLIQTTTLLGQRGYVAAFEHPGYVDVEISPEMHIHMGTVNGYYGVDVVGAEGDVLTGSEDLHWELPLGTPLAVVVDALQALVNQLKGGAK